MKFPECRRCCQPIVRPPLIECSSSAPAWNRRQGFRSGSAMSRTRGHALGPWRCPWPQQKRTARIALAPRVALFSVPSQFDHRAVQASLIDRIATQPASSRDLDLDIGDCLEYTFGPDKRCLSPSRNSSASAGTGRSTGRGAGTNPARPPSRITSAFNGRVATGSRTFATLDINDLSHDCYLLHLKQKEKKGYQGVSSTESF